MNPKFAKHIDPVFEYVLSILERAEKGKEPGPAEEKAKIRARLDRIDASLGSDLNWRDEWELAKYALVAWIDECLVYGCPWDGAGEWQNSPLETDLYQEGFQSGNPEEFFDRADKAAQLRNKDALEVYYLAVILGFRGMYRPEAGRSGTDPKALRKWLKKTVTTIDVGQGKRNIPRKVRSGEGAHPLRGRFEFLSAFVWFLILLSIAGIMFVVRTLGE